MAIGTIDLDQGGLLTSKVIDDDSWRVHAPEKVLVGVEFRVGSVHEVPEGDGKLGEVS